MSKKATRWSTYIRRGKIDLRPYVDGEDLTGVEVAQVDKPKVGDMVARNPANHKDQWLVAEKYFKTHYRKEE